MSWAKIAESIRIAAFFVESKVGKTGLTVTVDVYRNGTEVVTGASATDRGDGFYDYVLDGATVVTEAGTYYYVFKTSTSTVDQQHVPGVMLVGMAGVEHLDADISSRAASGASVTVSSPVVDAGTIEVVKGDSYAASQSRAIDFTFSGVPDLSTADSLTLTVRSPDGNRLLEATGSDLSATQIRFELTSAQTGALNPGSYFFDIQAVFPGSLRVTLARGDFSVLSDASA